MTQNAVGSTHSTRRLLVDPQGPDGRLGSKPAENGRALSARPVKVPLIGALDKRGAEDEEGAEEDRGGRLVGLSGLSACLTEQQKANM